MSKQFDTRVVEYAYAAETLVQHNLEVNEVQPDGTTVKKYATSIITTYNLKDADKNPIGTKMIDSIFYSATPNTQRTKNQLKQLINEQIKLKWVTDVKNLSGFEEAV